MMIHESLIAILGNFIIGNKWTVVVIIWLSNLEMHRGPMHMSVWRDTETHRDGDRKRA